MILNEAFLKIPDFPEYIVLFGYVGIFLFFVTVDQLSFIPEEITLITIGYLSSKGIFNPAIAGIVSLFSFLFIDSVYFYITHSGKKWSKKLTAKVEGPLFMKAKEKFKDNFVKTLFIFCFIPRMRMWAPVISAALDIPYRKFVKYDTIILAIFTTAYISLGSFFHKGVHTILKEMEAIQNTLFLFLLIASAITAFIIMKSFKKRI